MCGFYFLPTNPVIYLFSLCVIRYLHRAIDPDAPPLSPQPKPSSPYRTVGCVFNHHSFLANCQPSDAVELCVFDFQVRRRKHGMVELSFTSVLGAVISLDSL